MGLDGGMTDSRTDLETSSTTNLKPTAHFHHSPNGLNTNGYNPNGYKMSTASNSFSWYSRFSSSLTFKRILLVMFSSIVAFCTYKVLIYDILLLSLAARPTSAIANNGLSAATTTVPQYFQTTPELWAGPTATGVAPFLAQTNPVSFGPSATYIPNAPLETAMPIVGNPQNASIFHLMGHLSPYFPNPLGFGVNEYPLPPGANITQVQMLSRHGSRYPTAESNVQSFGERIANASGTLHATDQLSFLNDWKYQLGDEILVPRGRQELFESGILHYYNYGRLYNPHSKIIVRTTTQDRMLKSAEYFLAGFFGLEWTNNATIEVIIEDLGFNNSLAGYMNCPNSNLPVSAGGYNASALWVSTYLQNATERFQGMIEGYDWTILDTYAAQNLCPYETVRLFTSSLPHVLISLSIGCLWL
jgi:hypothetical protein